MNRPDADKIKELEEKINQLEKCESVSRYYIEQMRGALAGLKHGDVNSAMRFLIAVLLEPKKPPLMGRKYQMRYNLV